MPNVSLLMNGSYALYIKLSLVDGCHGSRDLKWRPDKTQFSVNISYDYHLRRCRHHNGASWSSLGASRTLGGWHSSCRTDCTCKKHYWRRRQTGGDTVRICHKTQWGSMWVYFCTEYFNIVAVSFFYGHYYKFNKHGTKLCILISYTDTWLLIFQRL
jgi:hypothetical protein